MSEKENNDREPLKSDSEKDKGSGRKKQQDGEQNQQDEEFRSIEHIGREGLLEEIGQMDNFVSDQVVRGIGDDAAVTDETEQRAGLLTSESFLEGVNFDLTYTPLHHLGYKVVSSTVSDIYAMNGRPTAMLLNVALPNKLSVDMVKQIYRGIYSAGRDYGVQLAGGDLTASHNILTLNATAYGRAEKAKLTYRSGAKEGDVLCLTGDLGGAMAGLRILMREKQHWQDQGEEQYMQPDFSEFEYVIQRQLVPAARDDVIDMLDSLELCPTAMIDVTQGLLHDAYQLADASRTGFYIYQSTIPIAIQTRSVADEMKEDVDKYALYGGEDMELLFTMPEEQAETLHDKFDDFAIIGKITDPDEGMVMQTPHGEIDLFGGEEEQ